MTPRSSFLPCISVLRPVSITMCPVALLVLGVVAYLRVPLKLMPAGLDQPFLSVRISYLNAMNDEPQVCFEELWGPACN